MKKSSRRKFLERVALLAVALISLPVKLFAGRNGCHTGSDVAGPFHRPNAPFRDNLTLGMSVKGELIEVRGTVFGNDCKSVLAGALLEIWHSDPKGEYDMRTNDFVGHARIKTSSSGDYYFKTYIPGYYTDAGMDRPKHIHYKISATGHKTLVTQLYFKGDKRLDNDPFVNQNNGLERALPYEKNEKGVYQLRFDIYLRTL